jgi:exonuclease III
MKIITWNCNGAFRKKAAAILALKPDILVIPECEHPDNLIFAEDLENPTDYLWFGNNQHKGIGIFSYSDFQFKVLKNYNKDLQLIIPIAVKGGAFDFTLFAIWANNPTDNDGQYVEQIWKALNHYKRSLKKTSTILIGDFNSNAIWDKKRRVGNHSTVVKHLAEKGIVSAYHLHHQQIQGKESDPTFYLYKHKDKPYHIDFCFVSEDLTKNMESVEIGTHEDWTKLSDHVPVIVTIKNC